MTPEQLKARELVEMFSSRCAGYSQSILNLDLAKQCAVIHVTGIIEELTLLADEMGMRFYKQEKGRKAFYQAVLTEINKID